MDNQNHKNTWNNLHKICVVGNCRCHRCFSFNGNILAIKFSMRIASVLENQNIEKRIAITPEIAKKYIALGFEISLVEKYGEHLRF